MERGCRIALLAGETHVTGLLRRSASETVATDLDRAYSRKASHRKRHLWLDTVWTTLQLIPWPFNFPDLHWGLE